MPSIIRVFGDATVTVSFITMGFGALVMCFAPGLLPRVVGLIIVGFGGAPLYPADRRPFVHLSAEHKIDSISLGAICILASGTAVTLGPLGDGCAGRLRRPSMGAVDRAGRLCSGRLSRSGPRSPRREIAAALD